MRSRARVALICLKNHPLSGRLGTSALAVPPWLRLDDFGVRGSIHAGEAAALDLDDACSAGAHCDRLPCHAACGDKASYCAAELMARNRKQGGWSYKEQRRLLELAKHSRPAEEIANLMKQFGWEFRSTRIACSLRRPKATRRPASAGRLALMVANHETNHAVMALGITGHDQFKFSR
jgi:hypothetical protein